MEFGNPITSATLEGLPEYEGKKIGAVDRARVALNWKNAEGKDLKALQFLQNLKETCGADRATLCLVYNATGGTVEYAGNKDWEGLLGDAPFPTMIQNGQWGAFLHRQNSSESGSIGAVVYRGTNAENQDCDWMVSWCNPYHKNNTAYTEAREPNHFNSSIWEYIRDKKIFNSDIQDKSDWGGCLSFVSIGNDRYATFTAVLTLKDAYK